MSIQNTVVNIVMFGSGIRPYELTPDPYISEYNWLFLVKEGSLLYTQGNFKRMLSPNHIYIFPAYKSFMLTDVEGKRLDHIYAEIKCSRPIKEFIDIDVENNAFIQDIFTVMLIHRKSLDSITLTMLLSTALHELLSFDIRENDIAREIKAHIDKRLPLFSIKEVVSDFNYSKRYLDKKFTEAYNTSIVKYGKNEQMVYVANSLKDGISLSAICEEINYSSTANLSRDFKKHFGISPFKFKKVHTP